MARRTPANTLVMSRTRIPSSGPPLPADATETNLRFVPRMPCATCFSAREDRANARTVLSEPDMVLPHLCRCPKRHRQVLSSTYSSFAAQKEENISSIGTLDTESYIPTQKEFNSNCLTRCEILARSRGCRIGTTYILADQDSLM